MGKFNVNTTAGTTALATVAVDNKQTKKWVLTLKDKKDKSFSNVVFYTTDVKVAQQYIAEVKKAGKQSFVSLADTERLGKYLYNNEVTKLFITNLKYIADRSKGTVDTKKMFAEVMAAINCRNEVARELGQTVDTLTVKYTG